jgi:hypothetical protein
MFTGDQVKLDIGFDVARDRLACLADGRWLQDASRDSYGAGIVGFTRVGPTPALSKLVRVHVRKLPAAADYAGLAIRWEAAGQAGLLFPVLDADLTVTPAAGDTCTLALAAVYRPPLGVVGAGLDRAVLRGVATTTIRAFLRQVAEAMLRTDVTERRDVRLCGARPNSDGLDSPGDGSGSFS